MTRWQRRRAGSIVRSVFPSLLRTALVQALVSILLILSAVSLNARELEGGMLLVAKEGMQDPNFRKSVVLIAQHGEEGTFGVVVNKETSFTLQDVVTGSDILARHSEPVYIGGPVALGTLLFIFRSEAQRENAIKVFQDVYLSADIKQLERLLDTGQPHGALKVIAGHAGWAPGQLERELERGDWFLIRAHSGVMFDRPSERLWHDLIELLTGLWAAVTAGVRAVFTLG